MATIGFVTLIILFIACGVGCVYFLYGARGLYKLYGKTMASDVWFNLIIGLTLLTIASVIGYYIYTHTLLQITIK